MKDNQQLGTSAKGLVSIIIFCFIITATSISAVLYFHVQNNRLNREAYNFWVVRALYPKVASTIDTKQSEDPQNFVMIAKKAAVKQQMIIGIEGVEEKLGKDKNDVKQKPKKNERNK